MEINTDQICLWEDTSVYKRLCCLICASFLLSQILCYLDPDYRKVRFSCLLTSMEGKGVPLDLRLFRHARAKAIAGPIKSLQIRCSRFLPQPAYVCFP